MHDRKTQPAPTRSTAAPPALTRQTSTRQTPMRPESSRPGPLSRNPHGRCPRDGRHPTGTHPTGTHTTAGTRRTPAKALRESTFEAAKPVTGRKTSARVNSRGTFAAASPQRCLRSGAIAVAPSQRHLLSGAATGRLQNGSRPASAPFTRRPRLCYARSSPLVAITFWYQAKLSLRERSSVPLP